MAQNETSAIEARRSIDGCRVIATRVRPEVINRALMLTTCMYAPWFYRQQAALSQWLRNSTCFKLKCSNCRVLDVLSSTTSWLFAEVLSL